MEVKKDTKDEYKLVIEETIPTRVTKQTFGIKVLRQKLEFLEQTIQNMTAERDQLKFVIAEAIKAGVKEVVDEPEPV